MTSPYLLFSPLPVKRACLCIMALFLFAGVPLQQAQAEATVIRFFHANDMDNMEPSRGLGGVAALATQIEAQRAGTPHHIVTFGGDTISPSIMSSIDQGAHMVDLLNTIGVDVAVLGNHEFDFGPEVAAQRVSEANFPWLASNLVDTDGNPVVGAKTEVILERGGYKIGFFGLLTSDTQEIASPGDSIQFLDIIETGTAAVAALQDQGADIIVALTHQFLEDDIRLAQEVPGITVILGGHDHAPVTHAVGPTLIMKAGDNAKHLLTLDLALEQVERRGKTQLQITPSWHYSSSRGAEPHPEAQAVIAKYLKQLDADLGQPVGETAANLDSRRAMVRTRETNFGSLIADAMRSGTGADVGITNGGGIRGDREYPAGSVLTRRDITAELPFGNVVVVLKATGADIQAALENGVSQVEKIAGRFPQVSGMDFTWDAAAPPGARIVSIAINGAPLDPEATYTVATNDYMYSGGDGYTAFEGLPALISAADGTLMASMVMNYITANGKVPALSAGRITQKN